MLNRAEKIKLLGNQIGRGFVAATEPLGHVWTRDDRGVAVCQTCGAVARAADARWKAKCDGEVAL